MNPVMEPMFRDVDCTTAGSLADLGAGHSVDSFLQLWSCAGTSGAFALNEDLPRRLYVFMAGTNSGAALTSDPMPFQSALGEMRQRSHLTWDQLASIFHVNRRSLHFWARGARPSAENAERIGKVLGILRHFDTGDPERTREELLQPRWNGARPIVHLLCERQDDTILELVSLASPSAVQRRIAAPASSTAV